MKEHLLSVGKDCTSSNTEINKTRALRSAGEQEGKGRGTQVGSNIKESGNKCCKVTNRSLVETFP